TQLRTKRPGSRPRCLASLLDSIPAARPPTAGCQQQRRQVPCPTAICAWKRTSNAYTITYPRRYCTEDRHCLVRRNTWPERGTFEDAPPGIAGPRALGG